MNSELTNAEAVASPLLMGTPEKMGRRGPLAALRQWWVPFSASSIFVVSGHLLIKSGLSTGIATSIADPLWMRILHLVLQPQVAGGLTVYLLGSLCWIAAVSQQEISFLYPLSSINYVLVVFASSAFFHESLSMNRFFGVALIVVGMVLMNRKSRGAQR